MDVPDDRCGFAFRPDRHRDDFEKSDYWRVDGSTAYCWRERWRENDLCIWHADSDNKPIDELVASRSDGPERLDGAVLTGIDVLEVPMDFFSEVKLSGANLSGIDLTMLGGLSGIDLSGADLSEVYGEASSLSGANLSEATLQGADLQSASLVEANLQGADLRNTVLAESKLDGADFSETNLSGVSLQTANISETDFCEADLSNAYLRQVDMSGEDLRGADLSGADFRDGDVSGSNLEEADLTRSDLRDATLTDVRLYEAVLSDLRINVNTDFGDTCAYETPGIDPESGDAHRLQAAVWTYRQLERVYRDFALVDRANSYRFRKVEAHREYQLEERNIRAYFVSLLNRWISRHSERPGLVISWSLVIILGCGIVYPFFEGMRTVPSNSTPVAYSEWFGDFLIFFRVGSIYF